MKHYLFSRTAVLLGAAVGALAIVPAVASAGTKAVATTTPESCPTSPLLSQPFRSYGDTNWYTPAPGVTADNFSATGWVLTGGAHVVTTTLADGATGAVLDLPPGSSATSPTLCVQTGEPFARQIARMVGTKAANNDTTLYVTTAGSTALGSGMPVLGKAAWAESPPDNVFPGSGVQNVYFTYKSNATVGDLQVYGLFIDPRMKR